MNLLNFPSDPQLFANIITHTRTKAFVSGVLIIYFLDAGSRKQEADGFCIRKQPRRTRCTLAQGLWCRCEFLCDFYLEKLLFLRHFVLHLTPDGAGYTPPRHLLKGLGTGGAPAKSHEEGHGEQS